MSLSSLPIELLDAICEPLASNPATLATLALTCTTFNACATRQLYRTLSVSAYARTLPIVQTLARRPDLAALVHSFALTLDDADFAFRPFYVLLRSALGHMSHLVSLELLVDSNASWVLSSPSAQFQLSQLEQFTCSFPLDMHVSAFLGRTPALRSLQISEPALPSCQNLPDTHIPLLESYTGPASLLPLLASRPVSTIYLSGDLRLEDIPQPSGAPNAREIELNLYPYPAPKNSDSDGGIKRREQVQVFSAITSETPAPLLEALALAYPGLVCLRVMTTSAFWDAPDMTLYTRIAATLASLSALTVFELSGMHWEARPKAPTSPSGFGVGPEEKEWISPPVTPRAVEGNEGHEFTMENQSPELGLGDAFYDWLD
ncbi:uncharacterized protein FIBRA_04934 [Fibroporia radiculosa]|uniref:Uncharacterized protein n=1 Tax=Fibroporia radiculosa TaxID=599839 RepID=J4HWT5_9APHY|nr:uncharacterized protein FIBRA_04934 [Fibroporia radiculosa]CCM02822.1 predicted protein [Fibroporia radiculosa]